jgi:hypothetical protein
MWKSNLSNITVTLSVALALTTPCMAKSCAVIGCHAFQIPGADPLAKAKLDAWLGECEQHIARSALPKQDKLKNFSLSAFLCPRLDGTIERINISKSSGSQEMDNMVVELIRKAGPFEPCSIDLLTTRGIMVSVNHGYVAAKIAPPGALREGIWNTAPHERQGGNP